MSSFLFVMNTCFILFTKGHQRCFARDCQDYKDRGFSASGVYRVTPVGFYDGFDVYCDMETDNGGWLVFQRRDNGSLDFYREWHDYEFGFGHLSGEHWLGNYFIHWITHQGCYELQIELEDWEKNTAFANYKVFRVEHAKERYQLIVSGYSGNAGDSLSQQSQSSFSTPDQDNDNYGGHCAVRYQGAWWFNSCHSSNLNGIYLQGNHSDYAIGVIWNTWRGTRYSIKKTEMKMRRI